MKTRNLKWADVLTLILFYVTAAMVVCIMLYLFSDSVLKIAENICSYLYIGVGMLFLGLLIFRCVKIPITKPTKVESIIAVIFAVLTALTLLVWVVYDMINMPSSVLSPILVMIIPAVLIALSFVIRAKKLFLLIMIAFWLHTALIVCLAISTNIVQPFEIFTFQLGLTLIIPLIFFSILCTLNYRLIKAGAEISDIAALQKTIGIFSVFSVVMVFFFLGPAVPFMKEEYVFGFSLDLVLFMGLVALPCAIYYVAMKVAFIKYRREEEENLSEKIVVAE